MILYALTPMIIIKACHLHTMLSTVAHGCCQMWRPSSRWGSSRRSCRQLPIMPAGALSPAFRVTVFSPTVNRSSVTQHPFSSMFSRRQYCPWRRRIPASIRPGNPGAHRTDQRNPNLAQGIRSPNRTFRYYSLIKNWPTKWILWWTPLGQQLR